LGICLISIALFTIIQIYTNQITPALADLKIRVQQINCIVGDIRGNTSRILDALRDAEIDHIDLLVLPELVVCGYPPADLLEKKQFREKMYETNNEIISQTKSTALLFGSILPNDGYGRPVYNAAILASHGNTLHITYKTLLPTYDIFDELRYFEPNNSFQITEFMGVKLGITICEDIWNNDNEIVYHRYDLNPAEILKKMGAEVLVNISASPFSKKKSDVRMRMLKNHALSCDLPIVYSNMVGANTEVIFDGDSMVLQRDGTVVVSTELFHDSLADVIWESKKGHFRSLGGSNTREEDEQKRIFEALKLGIRDYIEKSGLSKKVFIGLSGGVDSALVAVLATEALGSENVAAVTMPSMFSSEGSVTDSEHLAKSLGIQLHQLSIADIYDVFTSKLGSLFEGSSFGLAEENLQSRIRGVLLMALSNKFGGIVLNTGNKSELAVGYCTLYGDMNGGLSVISDLYKTEVYSLCDWLNEKHFGKEVIPKSILVKPPSAELRPDQKDSDSLPDYDVLDGILSHFIESQSSIDEIVARGYDLETVRKVQTLTDMAEYKRRQSPPGLRLSAKAFGIGRRLPIVQKWTDQ
jgi:NAD+ synthase (glutamine-hydrolysing)